MRPRRGAELNTPGRGLAMLRRVACGLLMAWAATAAQAQGASPASAHATRTGMAFTELEEALLHAQRAGQVEAVAALLSEDFQMVLAQDGGAIVPREDWLDAAIKPGAGAWVVSQLSTYDFGDVAQVNFVLRASPPRARAVPLAVVDTWRRDGPHWRLAVRHVASAAGSRQGIPGDAPTRNVIKKY
jgi:hypothetical protein